MRLFWAVHVHELLQYSMASIPGHRFHMQAYGKQMKTAK